VLFESRCDGVNVFFDAQSSQMGGCWGYRYILDAVFLCLLYSMNVGCADPEILDLISLILSELCMRCEEEDHD